jgi:hypothetical protein
MTLVGDPSMHSIWIDHARSRLNLAMRLASRANHVLASDGAAKGPLRLVMVAASAFGDVALARRLRASAKPGLLVQAAAVAADLTLWTALATESGDDQASTSLNTSSPFLVELGARHGLAAFVAPFLNVGFVAQVRRRRGWKTSPSLLMFQVISVVVGVGTSTYERRSLAQFNLRQRALDEAENAQVELSAVNDLMMSDGTLVDEVQRLTALIVLSDGRPRSARATTQEDQSPGALRLGAAKADAAQQVRASYAFLADVLREWEQQHNGGGGLADLVTLSFSPDTGRVVLSAEMARRLSESLDRARLRGRVAVRVHSATARELVIELNGETCTVTDDSATQPVLVDNIPAALVWMMSMFLVATPRDGVRPSLGIAPAAGAAGLAVLAHRSAQSTGHVDRPPIVRASSLLTAVGAIAQSADARVGRVPVSLGLRAQTLVAALSWPSLSQRRRQETALLGMLTIVGSLIVSKRPRSLRPVLAELCWPVMSFGIASAWNIAASRMAADEHARLAHTTEADRSLARSRGRTSVLASIQSSLDEAEELLRVAELDPRIRSECERRLDLCRRLFDDEALAR